MSIEESIKLVDKGNIALIELDLIGEKVNKLNAAVMVRFKEVVEEIRNSKFKAAVIISRKKKIFIAGADIDEIKSKTTTEDFRAAINPAHEILNAVEDHPVPFIAAIHGACAGGGCELSLACDYRICSDDKSTRIGLPEVKLGVIPGFGGCVRLPRAVGLQAAMDIILNGKLVDSRKAKKIGLVDEVVPAERLEERAMQMAEEVASGLKGKRVKRFKPRSTMDKFLESFMGKPLVFKKSREAVMKFTKGFYPAPLKAIEVVKKTYGMKNRDKALNIEMEGFCEVGITEISKNLIDVFYMLESVKKHEGVEDKAVKPIDVTQMGVLGAGTMGGGVAYVAADKGVEVRMKDITPEAIGIGLKHARDLWQKKLKRRRLKKYDYEKRMGAVSGGLDWTGFDKTQVVVEAIVEDMNIKKKVIADMAQHLSSDCVVATNTSSLSVTEMAKAMPNPENFVGMHFFNPVDKMPLVEVIRGEKTSDVATATIFNLAKKMGKTPVVVKDGPGFLVNRLLLPYMGEALFLLEEGMSIETVDRFYTHKFGMPMGPFRLMDEVGLDVGMKVLKIFQEALGDRIQVSELAKNVTGSDRLGKKNRKGFYLYDNRGKETEVDQTIYKEFGLSKPSDPLGEKECLERGIFQMVNEAALALIDERIATSPQEVDLAMIMGTGFPPFRGGLLKYADSLGTEYVVQELELYASNYGQRFKPTTPLVNLSKNNRKFYDIRFDGSSKAASSVGSTEAHP